MFTRALYCQIIEQLGLKDLSRNLHVICVISFLSKFHKTTGVLHNLSQNYIFKSLFHKTTDLVSSFITKLQVLCTIYHKTIDLKTCFTKL